MMAPRRSMRRLYVASTRWCAVSLRVCVVLAAWQGPIPWFHSHGTLAQACDDLWLIEHLRFYHSAAQTCPSECSGWHFHYGFPGSPADDSGPAPDGALHQATVMEAAARCSGLLSAWHAPPLAAIGTADDVVGSACGISPEAIRFHFFDAFAPTLALPLRFCCLIC